MRRLLPGLAIILLLVRPACAWGPDGHESSPPLPRKRCHRLHANRQATSPAKVHSLAEIANGPTWCSVPALHNGTRRHSLLHVRRVMTAHAIATTTAMLWSRSTPIQQLSDRSLLPAVRLEALKFLVHFVGDMHQPLHCADNHDRGK